MSRCIVSGELCMDVHYPLFTIHFLQQSLDSILTYNIIKIVFIKFIWSWLCFTLACVWGGVVSRRTDVTT